MRKPKENVFVVCVVQQEFIKQSVKVLFQSADMRLQEKAIDSNSHFVASPISYGSVFSSVQNAETIERIVYRRFGEIEFRSGEHLFETHLASVKTFKKQRNFRGAAR